MDPIKTVIQQAMDCVREHNLDSAPRAGVKPILFTLMMDVPGEKGTYCTSVAYLRDGDLDGRFLRDAAQRMASELYSHRLNGQLYAIADLRQGNKFVSMRFVDLEKALQKLRRFESLEGKSPGDYVICKLNPGQDIGYVATDHQIEEGIR